MSELTTAARPYARAVFELANESDSLSAWSESLAFMGAVASNDDVQRVLDNPKMTRQAAADAFGEFCDNKLDDKAQNMVRLLAENGRLVLLPEISRLFDTLKSEAEGAIDAEVTSAYEMDEATQAGIAEALKQRLGRDINLSVTVDESLLGGAIIRAGDLVIDGSLQGRVRKMTMALNG